MFVLVSLADVVSVLPEHLTPAEDVEAKANQEENLAINATDDPDAENSTNSKSSNGLDDNSTVLDNFTTKPLTIADRIAEDIQERTCDRIIPDSGLGVCLWDIQSIKDGYIYPGDMLHFVGQASFKVQFRMVVFRPMVGEIIEGRVKSASIDGLKITLGFFEDIYLPSTNMQTMDRTTSIYKPMENIWSWNYVDEGQMSSFPYTIGSPIRFKVTQVKFASAEELRRMPEAAPMRVVASCNGQGLGLTEWWAHNDEEEEEEGEGELVEEGDHNEGMDFEEGEWEEGGEEGGEMEVEGEENGAANHANAAKNSGEKEASKSMVESNEHEQAIVASESSQESLDSGELESGALQSEEGGLEEGDEDSDGDVFGGPFSGDITLGGKTVGGATVGGDGFEDGYEEGG